MFRQIHGRCWIAGVPGEPITRHHRTDKAAARAFTDRMLDAWDRWHDGEIARHDVPVQDMWQLETPCWTLRCDGCRQLLDVAGLTHFPSMAAFAKAAHDHGWDVDLLLCAHCQTLVVPLRPRTGQQGAAPAAG